uniref:Uncharacterized protein n=1 Tax=Acrobeloides nanus TaxID=290746 RepID=A0A914E4P8_9BILA
MKLVGEILIFLLGATLVFGFGQYTARGQNSQVEECKQFCLSGVDQLNKCCQNLGYNFTGAGNDDSSGLRLVGCKRIPLCYDDVEWNCYTAYCYKRCSSGKPPC